MKMLKSWTRKAAAGFTLTELIITMVVLIIFSAIAIPNLRKMLYSEKSTASARLLAGWIDERRRQAIQSSDPCIISIDIEESVFRQSDTNRCGDFPTLYLRKELPKNNNIKLTLLNQSPTEWIFTSRGTIYQEPNTSSDDLELLIEDEQSSAVASRCFKVTAPLGLVRSGRYINETCDYTNVF